MNALHFGAGNIGRGFIGKVLFESGYHLTFADVNKDIINQIKGNQYYDVRYVEEEKRQFRISNVDALHSITELDAVIEQISKVDLITTSVGVDNLSKLVQIIISGLEARGTKPIDIICNENSLNATSQLRGLIEKELMTGNYNINLDNVGFLNSAIDRQAMNEFEAGVDIAVVEPFYEWIIEINDLKNPVNKSIVGAHYVKDIMPFIERKLFIVNSEHAISAYIGYLHSKSTIQDVLASDQLVEYIRNVLDEHADYLKYKYQTEDLDDYINTTLKRHGNTLLSDDIHRVGRNPLRKLSKTERIVGPVIKLNELGISATNSIKSIAIAMKYRNEEDQEAVKLAHILDENSIEEAIKIITSIEDEELIAQIANEYNEL